MAGISQIEWTDKSWNPVRGCAMVSEGCRNCYAQVMAHRFSGAGLPYEGLTRPTSQGPRWTGAVTLVEKDIEAPLRWRTPAKIFVNSMSDLFYDRIPVGYYHRVWDVMTRANWHTFQVLTKRPETMVERTRGVSTPGHIWMGVSVESAQHLGRVDLLREVPAPVRFLSLEPLLSPLPGLDLSGIAWVIVGGESGRGARSIHADWVRDIRDQCVAANVAFFFKQWGGPQKGVTGRALDGHTWDQFPGQQASRRHLLPVVAHARALTRFDIIEREFADDAE